MTTDRETAEVIRSWMKEPATLDDAGLHRVIARLTDTAQRRYRWLPPFPALHWRAQSMFSATKYLVAGAIVALFGGLLFISLPTDQGPIPVVPGAETTTPEPIPTILQGPTPRPTPVAWQGLEAADPRLEGEPDHPLMNVGFSRLGQGDAGVWQVLDLAREGNEAAAYSIAIGSDWSVRLHDWSACGDHMAGEWLPCVWQVGVPGYSIFPTYESDDFGPIVVDPDGTLWASTDLGLEHFDGQTWTRYEHALVDSVQLSGSDAGIWAFGRTADGTPQLLQVDAGGLTVFEIDGALLEGAPDHAEYLMAAAADGSVWLAGQDGRGQGRFFCGIGVFESTCPSPLPTPVPLTELWGGFVAHFDGDSWERGASVTAGLGTRVGELSAGRDGSLWASASAEGDDLLLRYEGDGWTAFSPPGAAHHLAIDADGTVWFANPTDDGSSLVSFDGVAWDNYLGQQDISDIAIAPDGSVWVVGEDGLFAVADPARPGPE